MVPAVPTALVEDPAAPYAAMRRDLLPYFGLPFYRAMLERSGFGAEIEAFDAAAGDVAQMQAAISERFLTQLTAVGDESAVGAGLNRYRDAGATSPCVGPDPRERFRGHTASWDRVAGADERWPGSRVAADVLLSTGCRSIASSGDVDWRHR